MHVLIETKKPAIGISKQAIQYPAQRSWEMTGDYRVRGGGGGIDG